MPIDRTVFTREFTLLLDLFGREPHPLLTNRYFAFLDARLDTEAFERACQVIFEQDKFWPAPARFVDAARGGTPRELADAAFAEVLQLAERGEFPPLATFPAPVRAALKAAPMREIAYADANGKLPSLQRAFTAAYASALETQPDAGERPALAAPADDTTDTDDLATFFGAGDDR